MTLEAGLLFSSGSVLGLSRAGEEQESRSILTCVNMSTKIFIMMYSFTSAAPPP